MWLRRMIVVLGVNGLLMVGCRTASGGVSTKAVTTSPTVATKVAIFVNTKHIPLAPSNLARLKKAFHNSYPDGRFVYNSHFDVGDLRAIKLADGDDVHLIFMGHGGLGFIQTETANTFYLSLGQAVTDFAKSAPHVKMSTSIIACNSGSNNCKSFPGDVFGAAANGQTVPRLLPATFFIGLDNNLYPFPMTAAEMFSDFNKATATYRPNSTNSYWYQNGGMGDDVQRVNAGDVDPNAPDPFLGKEEVFLEDQPDGSFKELGSHPITMDDRETFNPADRPPVDAPNEATERNTDGKAAPGAAPRPATDGRR